MLARLKSVVFSELCGFLHHIRSQNANVHAFKNANVSYMGSSFRSDYHYTVSTKRNANFQMAFLGGGGGGGKIY